MLQEHQSNPEHDQDHHSHPHQDHPHRDLLKRNSPVPSPLPLLADAAKKDESVMDPSTSVFVTSGPRSELDREFVPVQKSDVCDESDEHLYCKSLSASTKSKTGSSSPWSGLESKMLPSDVEENKASSPPSSSASSSLFALPSIKTELQENHNLITGPNISVNGVDITDKEMLPPMRMSDQDDAMVPKIGASLLFDGNTTTISSSAAAVDVSAPVVTGGDNASGGFVPPPVCHKQALPLIEADNQSRLDSFCLLEDNPAGRSPLVFQPQVEDSDLMDQDWGTFDDAVAHEARKRDHHQNRSLGNGDVVPMSSSSNDGGGCKSDTTAVANARDASLFFEHCGHERRVDHVVSSYQSEFAMYSPWPTGAGPSTPGSLLSQPSQDHDPHHPNHGRDLADHHHRYQYQLPPCHHLGHQAEQRTVDYQPWLLTPSSKSGIGACTNGFSGGIGGELDSHYNKRMRPSSPSFSGADGSNFGPLPPLEVPQSHSVSMMGSSSISPGASHIHQDKSPSTFEGYQEQHLQHDLHQDHHHHHIHQLDHGRPERHDQHQHPQYEQQHQLQDHYPSPPPKRQRRPRHHQSQQSIYNANLDQMGSYATPTMVLSHQGVMTLSEAAALSGSHNNGFSADEGFAYPSYPSANFTSDFRPALEQHLYHSVPNGPYDQHVYLPLSTPNGEISTTSTSASVSAPVPVSTLPTKKGTYPRRSLSKQQLQALDPDPKYCDNCHTRSTPSWRRCPDGRILLCNACGLYQKLHRKPRPFFKARDGTIKIHRTPTAHDPCSICGTTETAAWKRGPNNEPICSACDLERKRSLSKKKTYPKSSGAQKRRYDNDDDKDVKEDRDEDWEEDEGHDRNHDNYGHGFSGDDQHHRYDGYLPQQDNNDQHHLHAHHEGQQAFEEEHRHHHHHHHEHLHHPEGSLISLSSDSSLSMPRSSATPSPPGWSMDRGIAYGYEGGDIGSDFGTVGGRASSSIMDPEHAGHDHHDHAMIENDDGVTELSPGKRPDVLGNASRRARVSAGRSSDETELTPTRSRSFKSKAK
ncbi:Trans-acting T-cell-specific transcription factor GATA-3 [Gryganskiella cystojenkinii]|nr:Trans-acting T-cell-specific transcription factor GATA-3 [Gryganskiella cystojenkinii]